MPDYTIVLASSSPSRHVLLKQLQIPFTVDVPDIDETAIPSETAPQLVKRLAISKAQRVAEKYPHALVIGADQVAVHNGRIVGKPHTHDNAMQQLMEVAGKKITHYTGLALINSATQNCQSTTVPYTVRYRDFTHQTAEYYLRKTQPYYCAGSLQVEGPGIALIQELEGDDYSALIGLPLIYLCNMLTNEGVDIFVSSLV